MKKVIALLGLLVLPNTLFASYSQYESKHTLQIAQIPNRFMSTGKTDTLEWGCPIQEMVQARDSADALDKIGQACMDDVRNAASLKPGVFDVIRVSVIWPDVEVSKTPKGYFLEGTVFLETLVMKGNEDAE